MRRGAMAQRHQKTTLLKGNTTDSREGSADMSHTEWPQFSTDWEKGIQSYGNSTHTGIQGRITEDGNLTLPARRGCVCVSESPRGRDRDRQREERKIRRGRVSPHCPGVAGGWDRRHVCLFMG